MLLLDNQSHCALFATGSKQREKPNLRAQLRAQLKRVSLRRLSLFTEVKISNKSFWDHYKCISQEQTGLMGEMHDSSFPNAPKIRAIMNLAEIESPEHYSKARADEYRAWLAWRLTDIDSGDAGKGLHNELEALSKC